MNKRQIVEGSYVHVFNKAHRKSLIVRDLQDCWRFMKMLCHFNDSYSSPNWIKDLNTNERRKPFSRPKIWPKKKPLTKILAYCLHPNHFHLLMKEIFQGGISKFMHKLGTELSNYLNIRYKEKGRIFQNTYRSKIIDTDNYLRNLACYIMIKNSFELYPGGLVKAINEFDLAYEWASNYPFCSLGEYLGKRELGIIDIDLLHDLFTTHEYFKEYARDFMKSSKYVELSKLSFDNYHGLLKTYTE